MRIPMIQLFLAVSVALWVAGCDANSSTLTTKGKSHDRSTASLQPRQTARPDTKPQTPKEAPFEADTSDRPMPPEAMAPGPQPQRAATQEEKEESLQKESANLGETVTALNEIVDSAIKTQRQLLTANLAPEQDEVVDPPQRDANSPL